MKIAAVVTFALMAVMLLLLWRAFRDPPDSFFEQLHPGRKALGSTVAFFAYVCMLVLCLSMIWSGTLSHWSFWAKVGSTAGAMVVSAIPGSFLKALILRIGVW